MEINDKSSNITLVSHAAGQQGRFPHRGRLGLRQNLCPYYCPLFAVPAGMLFGRPGASR